MSSSPVRPAVEPRWFDPPVLDSSVCVDAHSDVGPLYLHREDEFITPTILKTGRWEPAEGAFLRSVIAPGQCFLDVGANVGYFTLLGSRLVGADGLVVAVEPEPENVRLLRANLWRNGVSNARVLAVAAQNETGYVGLRLSATNTGDHQTAVANGHDGPMVPALRLDEVLADSTVDVVKIDAQGADHEVVAGLRETIAGNSDIVIMCEFWLPGMKTRGIDPAAVLAAYEEQGLRIGLLGADGAARAASANDAVAASQSAPGQFLNLVLTTDPSRVAMRDDDFARVQARGSASLGRSDPSPSDARPEEGNSCAPLPLRSTQEVDADVVDRVSQLAQAANRSGGGYHVLRPLPGITLAGQYDMADFLPAYRIPSDLSGKTVLDVGTASGFFATECARRGASVTALDLVLWDTHAWEISQLLQLDIRRVQMDIYDLDDSLGVFDLVICGSLLLHLPDPFGAIGRLRRVCRERAIVSTASPAQESEGPVCEFVGVEVDGGRYWSYWNIGAEALRRMLLAAGFDRVEHQDHFTLRPVPGNNPPWQIYHTVAHGVVAG